ncbi:hypothetical protein CR513_26268, partial [Mucuna pruriens]
LDQYQGLKMCKVDSITYTGLVEIEKIFNFLLGLNFEYDLIWVQILSKEKLPSLFENRRSVMLDKGSSNTRYAMVIGKGSTKGSTSEEKPFTKSGCGKYYKYCK